MNCTNTHARWRVLAVHLVAKLFGVLIKVEGMPFGSSRTRLANPPPREVQAGCGLLMGVDGLPVDSAQVLLGDFACQYCGHNAGNNHQKYHADRALKPRKSVEFWLWQIFTPIGMVGGMVAGMLSIRLVWKHWLHF